MCNSLFSNTGNTNTVSVQVKRSEPFLQASMAVNGAAKTETCFHMDARTTFPSVVGSNERPTAEISHISAYIMCSSVQANRDCLSQRLGTTQAMTSLESLHTVLLPYVKL